MSRFTTQGQFLIDATGKYRFVIAALGKTEYIAADLNGIAIVKGTFGTPEQATLAAQLAALSQDYTDELENRMDRIVVLAKNTSKATKEQVIELLDMIAAYLRKKQK